MAEILQFHVFARPDFAMGGPHGGEFRGPIADGLHGGGTPHFAMGAPHGGGASRNPVAVLAERPIYKGGQILRAWQKRFVQTCVEDHRLHGKARYLLADDVGLYPARLPAAAAWEHPLEGTVPRTNPWSHSLPRVELDQRSREASLRLEQIERLLKRPVRVRHSWFWRLLYLLSLGTCSATSQ